MYTTLDGLNPLHRLIDYCSDDNWCAFLKRFTESVQTVTGQVVDVKLASEADHSLLQDEVEQLRATVDQLSTEVRRSYVICSEAHSVCSEPSFEMSSISK